MKAFTLLVLATLLLLASVPKVELYLARRYRNEAEQVLDKSDDDYDEANKLNQSSGLTPVADVALHRARHQKNLERAVIAATFLCAIFAFGIFGTVAWYAYQEMSDERKRLQQAYIHSRQVKAQAKAERQAALDALDGLYAAQQPTVVSFPGKEPPAKAG